MKNKFLKAAVFAMVLGVAGPSMAANYAAPTGSGNKYNASSSNQTVVGTNNTTDGASASAYGHYSYAIGKNTTAIGHGARTDDGTGTVVGTGSEGATAVGNFVTASGNNSVALGSGSDTTTRTKATGAQSIAIGYLTEASADNATAFGNEAKAQGGDSVAIGTEATATEAATNGLVFGTSSYVSKKNAVAIGTSSKVASENAMAFGYGSRVAGSSNDAIAIGTNAYVTVANAVAIGKDAAVSATSGNPTDRVVSFGHTTNDTYITADGSAKKYGSAETSRLINVTAGYQDTDAVNFSQINTVARSTATGDLANGTYIKSSLNEDGTALNDAGTVGANIAALDAKAVDSAQTVVLSNVARDTAKDYAGKKNEIVSNDGTVLATFDYAKIEDTMTEENRAKFVSAGDVYDAIAKRNQTISLDSTTTRETVNKKEIKGNQITTNDGTVLATFESEKPSSLNGKKFVTSGDVYAADVKSSQEVTLATSARETVNKVSIQKNQIATNDGTVLATFTSEKPAALDGTAFVTSGDVFAADTKESQTVTLDTSARETVNKVSIQKNQIATNEGKVLATFDVETEKPVADSKKFVNSGQVYNADTKVQTITLDNTKKANILKNNADDDLVTFQLATYKTGDKGFVNGGQLFDQSIAADQQVSFATGKNVIKNNKNDELVSFTEGVVAVAGGAKGATNTDANFVSAKNAYANDVAYAQTFTLDGNTLSGNFVTNAGATVGTVNITRGEVGEGNIGFVTGDDVWKAIASYNQKLDFSDVTPSNSKEETSADEKVDPTTQSDEGGADDADAGTEGGASEGTEGGAGGVTEAPKSSNVIYTNNGTPIAELVQGEVSKENTGFVSGGQVFEADVASDQMIDSTNNLIKNNNGDTLVTFTKGEVTKGNTGFVSGDQVNTVKTELNNADVAPDQTIDSTNNLIVNNNGGTLVTFTKGEVKEGNTGFVSGDQVNTVKTELSNADVAPDQTIDSTNNLIKNNNGDTIVTFTKGTVAEGNTGFVSGGDVYENTKNIKSDISKDIESVKTEVNKNFEEVNTKITDVNTRVDQTEQQISTLGGQVNDVDDRVKKVGAGAAALAALHPMDYDPNAKLTFAIGYGNYRSKSAAAIGAFIRPNNRFMWSLAATMGNGENMYNTGLSFAIGSGKGIRMSRAELDFKVNQISDSVKQMTEEHQTFARDNAQQDAAILDLHARLKKVEAILAQLTAAQ